MAKAEVAMHPSLQAALADYRTTRAFDVKGWVEKKCTAFNDYMRKCGLKGCVVSVSGGVDSAVTLALMKHAQKMPNSPIDRVVGICQPIHSSAWALERGAENCKALGAEYIVVDQTDLHTQLCEKVETAIKTPGEGFARGQLRSYMRAPVQYYVAQLISQAGSPCVVMGTGNQDEDGYLAYFCKAGDGVVDIQLISDIHKSEVFTVGRELGVPEATLVAPPSADLWDGQTDEEELGFTYDFIELWTGKIIPMGEDERKAFADGLPAEGKAQLEAWGKAAEGVHKRNAHKLAGVINL